jgi:hypothetical protein
MSNLQKLQKTKLKGLRRKHGTCLANCSLNEWDESWLDEISYPDVRDTADPDDAEITKKNTFTTKEVKKTLAEPYGPIVKATDVDIQKAGKHLANKIMKIEKYEDDEHYLCSFNMSDEDGKTWKEQIILSSAMIAELHEFTKNKKRIIKSSMDVPTKWSQPISGVSPSSFYQKSGTGFYNIKDMDTLMPDDPVFNKIGKYDKEKTFVGSKENGHKMHDRRFPIRYIVRTNV